MDPKEIIKTKLERLYKILDVNKNGKIYLQDFDFLFGKMQKYNNFSDYLGTSDYSNGFRVSNIISMKNEVFQDYQDHLDWRKGASIQIKKYITSNYSNSILDCFNGTFIYFIIIDIVSN